ncbi:MAG: hypothetical protein AABX53_03845 [Nanoarchaeota archaeon]
MELTTSEVVERLRNYDETRCEFTLYCRARMQKRGIDEEIVKQMLFSSKPPLYVKRQLLPLGNLSEERYKLIFSLSGRYSLIIIVAFYHNLLKVVNTIKTSKKLDKLWKRKT